MTLIVVAAMTEDRVIGRGDGLPWSIPEEYRHFLDLVRGHPLVLGRRTFEIFGSDLAESPLLVVSRSLAPRPRVRVFPTVEAAIEAGRELDETVFSAGGAEIYRQTIPLADAMYLSIVKGDYDGDVRFPRFDAADWRVERRDDHAGFEFRVYRRR